VRLIVGMTGATGAPLGVRLLEVLRDLDDVETHLVLSRWARTTVELETAYTAREVAKLADVVHGPGDQAAAISSGSFLTAGMVIVPCSMKTLAGIRTGYADGLIARAADVCLKERRRLVLVPRETPLNDVHLENMLGLSWMGATILPPVPAFYKQPASVADMADHLVVRILDQFGPAQRRAPGAGPACPPRAARRPPPPLMTPSPTTTPRSSRAHGVRVHPRGSAAREHPQDDQRGHRRDRGVAGGPPGGAAGGGVRGGARRPGVEQPGRRDRGAAHALGHGRRDARREDTGGEAAAGDPVVDGVPTSGKPVADLDPSTR
jgi:4-hydroxy-3-polyprenylbenzoate decarboxylase